MAAEVPLWLDCDPGHDDAFAILLSAHHPSLRLLGVSAVHGNASLDQTTNNARSVLLAIGRSDIVVHPGARKPFCRHAVHAPDIHGPSGLDGTDLLPKPLSSVPSTNAVLAMHDALLDEPPDTAWVVATGALTNVALLFATFPEVVKHIRGLSIMGGAIGDGFTDATMGKVGAEVRMGNTTPYAEFNIYCDPEAAQSIFSSPDLARKTTLIPLDLTHKVLATKTIQGRLLNEGLGLQKPSNVRRMFYELLMFFASTYDHVFGISDGPPLHDPIAVAVLLDEGSILEDSGGERWVADVVTDGEHYAEHQQGGDGTITETSAANQVGRVMIRATGKGQGGVRIPRALHLHRFWNEILDAVGRAEQHVDQQPS